jgi:enhancer of mRNA-decapping protein 3
LKTNHCTVLFLDTNHSLPLYRVDATQIKELEVAPHPPKAVVSPPVSAPQASGYAPPSGLSHYQQIYSNQSYSSAGQSQYGGPPVSNIYSQPAVPKTFISSKAVPSQPQDPAILSFNRKPGPSIRASSTPPPIPSELLPGGDLGVTASNHSTESRRTIQPKIKSQTPILDENRRQESTPLATLSSAVNNLNLADNVGEFDDTDDVTAPGNILQNSKITQQQSVKSKKDGYTGKRSRRGKRRPSMGSGEDMIPDGNGNALGSSPVTSRKIKKKILQKDGWRQGAFTEAQDPEGEQSELQPRLNTRRGRHRRQLAAGEGQDGWATEEATDIQTMGDFDFLGNLSKFDKKTVFNQIRQDDTTADESRLVSFNRLPQAKPGTAGGKNLHHTENVLDGPNGLDSDTSESDLDSAHQSGRSSRRAISRQSTLQMPSRKGSMAVGGTASITKPVLLATMNRAHHSSSHTGSPRIGPLSRSASPLPGTVSSSRPSLRAVPSNRTCGVINPLQMLDIERIMETEIGLTEDMMTENAGRGMAEVALSILNPGGKRIVKENHNSRPVVVVLAGSNRCGARALAAGRHLRNHGIQVLGCVLGLEREGEFLDSFKRQLHVFRKTHSKAVRLDELTATLASLDAPPELVFDGLLGMHAFEDLRVDDQATAYELIQWANKSKAPILAVDVPSGMDASTGMLSPSSSLSALVSNEAH